VSDVITTSDAPPATDGPLTATAVREELLQDYPTKTKRKREKQIVVNEKRRAADGTWELPVVAANARTVPGIITQRGCCYAGCKGVIMGPTRDIVNLVHGPIGCSFYAWLTRRNQTHAPTNEHDNFITYCFSTDMTEENIIFGGEKRLRQAIQEAYDLFHPKAIAVFSTCPVGLIGDDVHQVAAEMKAKLGINIFGFSCEGYKGVSQSAGHHIANNQVFKHIVGEDDTPRGKWSLNLLGEYNIGGDAFLIEDLFRRCGIDLVATFSGNSTYDQFANSHMAKLNCVMCHRSINYVADMIEKKYGTPWIKVNFIGAGATAKSLRKIAEYFQDDELTENVERVIGEEFPAVTAAQKKYRPRCEGKRAVLFVGGSRAHHYQELFAELGMETIAAGYEFAHRDDYEGRKVLPTIKVDADSRNIEELHVQQDPDKYRPEEQELARERERQGYRFQEYNGMMADMRDQTLIIDDISHSEAERLIELIKPDIFCAGIKEKYTVQKMGVPCKQLHSYDYGGPYAAFQGAINFYAEIDRMVNARIWSRIQPPWDKAAVLEEASRAAAEELEAAGEEN
jgi:nitrogenase molybdenum-iron protein alpha chain